MPRRRVTLPDFIPPMLAVLVPPFDSDNHLYEIKWDGFRSLCFVNGGVRLTGRRQTDFTARFPELSPLSKLPAGTVLDGEIVQLTGGKPDFQALLRRERSWSGSSSPKAGRYPPVTFVAFDLLYERFESVMNRPLVDRRERLAKLMEGMTTPRLAASDGHVGGGIALLDHAADAGLEGVVAKRLDGVYEPGGRSGSWCKFKRRQSVVCVVIGYLKNSTGGIKSLLLGTEVDDELRFVGLVGTGFDDKSHHKLLATLAKIPARLPAISCKVAGARWVRPDVFCRVSFAEWTNDRKLRQPVFESLI